MRHPNKFLKGVTDSDKAQSCKVRAKKQRHEETEYYFILPRQYTWRSFELVEAEAQMWFIFEESSSVLRAINMY